MGDLLFHPLARPGDADYGNLYVGMGDGTAGERAGVTHTIPPRLDALQGKILRITPDVKLRPRDNLGANGQYRIPSTGPNANPFVSLANARAEIYAYGFRNSSVKVGITDGRSEKAPSRFSSAVPTTAERAAGSTRQYRFPLPIRLP